MNPIEATFELLRSEFPGMNTNIMVSGRSQFLDLPAPPSAEYSFRLWFHERSAAGSDREIGARLVAQAEKPVDFYFWHWSFESARFRAEEALLEAFDHSLLTLIRHPTRIVQRRGLLTWMFRLDARLPELGWVPQYQHAGFRLGVRVPAIDGRERVYFSPALLST